MKIKDDTFKEIEILANIVELQHKKLQSNLSRSNETDLSGSNDAPKEQLELFSGVSE